LAVSISGNISNTTLTINQIPSHSHGYKSAYNGGSNTFFPDTNHNDVINVSGSTNNAGGGGSHNHGHNLSGSMTGSPSLSGNPTLSGNVTAGNLAVGASTASINVQYVDFIIANKD